MSAPLIPAGPRKLMKANHRQERFARVYAATLDPDRALEKAGYNLTTDEAKKEAKSRLLRNPAVRVIVDEIFAKVAANHGMDADGVMGRFKLVYLEAMADKDWTAAVAALVQIGKVYGIFERDNRQKHVTAEDAERIKKELEAWGVSFTRVNAPTVLVNDAEAPVVIPPPPENP